ncbi:hypothetical protein NPIL_346061 [Nephila pilipes]|uniref:Protein RED C-terminal domain-containing protein n=1 Tax=Nephila pilipes TaxID=299642 RepID=A0A8X6NQP0_NEPPI|nr:hypothetical protein NPIL_346061 [Nephila pilipes]
MPESYAECNPGAPKEYSENVSKKEALPKAAFRYNFKMAIGRKTRGIGPGKRDEKLNSSTIERDTFRVLEAMKKFDTWVCVARIQVISGQIPLNYLPNSASAGAHGEKRNTQK